MKRCEMDERNESRIDMDLEKMEESVNEEKKPNVLREKENSGPFLEALLSTEEDCLGCKVEGFVNR